MYLMDRVRIDKYIDSFLKNYQSYQTYWNYEDGCVLMGCRQLYEVTGDRKYSDYIIRYLESRVTPEGYIPSFSTDQLTLDSMNCGKLLFLAYDLMHDERYRKALDFHMKRLALQPRCKCGSFWHKDIYPDQIWLDGLYMACPLYMEYETRYDNKEKYGDIMLQFENVRKYMHSTDKGLYYHGYDESRLQPWANKDTGCSENFWSRASGWWLMALIDTMDVMSKQIYEQYRMLEDTFRDAAKSMLDYRSPEDGLIYQVIDHAGDTGNYTETSGSAMTAYAVMKGCRLKALLPEKYSPAGKEMFESICEHKLKRNPDGTDSLTDICHVAGLGPGDRRNGSLEYYYSEPRASDEAKGVGPFMMAYAEYLRSSDS